jgi:type II secretory pathway component PulF
MPWFEYEGLTPGGTAIAGRIESSSSTAAREDLARMGVDLRQLVESHAPVRRRAGLREDDLIFFNEQLASLAQAGLALDDGLEQLARDVHSPRLRVWLDGLVHDVRRGIPIEAAIATREEGLPVLYSRIIDAGIKSGELPATLLNLNQHLRLTGNTRRMMWEIVSYPLIVLLLGGTLGSVFLLFVVPKFVDIFADFGTELPGITLLLFNMSHWFLHGRPAGWMIVWLTPLVIALCWHMLRYSMAGRSIRENIVLSIPILGRVHQASIVARFLRSVATAVAAQIPLPQALRLSADATGSRLLTRDAEWLATEIERGHSIFIANQSTRVIPPLFGFCVQVGSGRDALPNAIGTLSKSYENRAMHSQVMLRTFFFPAMIIIVGGLIGFAIVALFMPLVHLVNSVSG